jgi:hypothetical protein
MSPTAHGATNGRITPDATVARITLRPIGSSLPLGAFTLVPAGLLVAGLQLGWFTPSSCSRASTS